MDYHARGGIIGRFQAQEFVSTKDERRPFALPVGNHLNLSNILSYCPRLYTYYVKLSSIYLFFSNLYEFRKKGQFFSAGKRS